MSSTDQLPFEQLHATLDDCASRNPVFLTTEQKQAAMLGWTAVIARAQAELMKVAAVADDIPETTGHRSTAAWLAEQTRDWPGASRTTLRLAKALDSRWSQTAQALSDGDINLAQARVITEALDDLPPDIDAAQLAKGEAFLLDHATSHGPGDLKILGAKLLEVIAPDIADHAEYQRLLASEQRAEAATKASFKTRGDGSLDFTARLPESIGHRLRTYLDAYTNPRRNHLDAGETGEMGEMGEVDELPIARRRGIAFCAFLENLPESGLPQHGGTATSVMVTLDHDTLVHGVGVATTDTGDTITAEQARRLACVAGIIAVVLGANSEILDLARQARLFTPAQRKAMALRDRHCTAHGCTIPAAWTEVVFPLFSRTGT